jgi:hypothetical protein
MRKKSDTNDEKNSNPNNEYNNNVPEKPEIAQPDPSTATPSFPQEMPIR